ncbi:MAG: hypothetical protein Q8S19_07970 [Bacillota bacterium]|nr:hypothetical protein [Bacillota bacterium]
MIKVKVMGVLVEVPVMLRLVRIANNTRHWFPQGKRSPVAQDESLCRNAEALVLSYPLWPW